MPKYEGLPPQYELLDKMGECVNDDIMRFLCLCPCAAAPFQTSTRPTIASLSARSPSNAYASTSSIQIRCEPLPRLMSASRHRPAMLRFVALSPFPCLPHGWPALTLPSSLFTLPLPFPALRSRTLVRCVVLPWHHQAGDKHLGAGVKKKPRATEVCWPFPTPCLCARRPSHSSDPEE